MLAIPPLGSHDFCPNRRATCGWPIEERAACHTRLARPSRRGPAAECSCLPAGPCAEPVQREELEVGHLPRDEGVPRTGVLGFTSFLFLEISNTISNASNCLCVQHVFKLIETTDMFMCCFRRIHEFYVYSCSISFYFFSFVKRFGTFICSM